MALASVASVACGGDGISAAPPDAVAPVTIVITSVTVDALLDDVLDGTSLTVDRASLYPELIAACADLERAAASAQTSLGRCGFGTTRNREPCLFDLSADVAVGIAPVEPSGADRARWASVEPRAFDPRRETPAGTCADLVFRRATRSADSRSSAYDAHTGEGDTAEIRLLADSRAGGNVLTGVDFSALSRAAWLGASTRGDALVARLRERVRLAPTSEDIRRLRGVEMGRYRSEADRALAALQAQVTALPAAIWVTDPAIEGADDDVRLSAWVGNRSERVVVAGSALLWVTVGGRGTPVRADKSCRDTTVTLSFRAVLAPGTRVRVFAELPAKLRRAIDDAPPGKRLSLRAAAGSAEFDDGERWESAESLGSQAECGE